MSNTKSIAIVGVGGQGTVLTSDILIEGLVDLGFDVKKTEQHGLSQRGGSVNCMVKYGDAVYAPIIADGEADVVVAFEKIEALRWLKLLKAGGILIVNDNEILPIPVKMGKASYPHDAIEQLQQTVKHVPRPGHGAGWPSSWAPSAGSGGRGGSSMGGPPCRERGGGKSPGAT